MYVLPRWSREPLPPEQAILGSSHSAKRWTASFKLQLGKITSKTRSINGSNGNTHKLIDCSCWHGGPGDTSAEVVGSCGCVHQPVIPVPLPGDSCVTHFFIQKQHADGVESSGAL
ncbi:hypothetical protein AV530_005154 [Patagioenas fasciata monilis]|uniref:Uncharacterized protein n=1 Tax=Patagioenas fasciata monilis TaxID=372326 RepID=A0A1V4K5Z0_PATFA|nr:hypothetical protein AV530_005154 [Patagioenas fasciata monilis]